MTGFRLRFEIEGIDLFCIGEYCTGTPSQSYEEESTHNEIDLQEIKVKSIDVMSIMDIAVIDDLKEKIYNPNILITMKDIEKLLQEVVLEIITIDVATNKIRKMLENAENEGFQRATAIALKVVNGHSGEL